MESNVLSWGEIIRSKTDLTGYHWQSETIPSGKFRAVLDLKVWSKKIAGINCYFRLVATGQLIRLTVFRLKDKTYRLPEKGIDFRDCPTDVCYDIEVALNGKGRICFRDCVLSNQG